MFPPTVPVTLATGEVLRVSRRAPIPAFDNVLYMDDGDLEISYVKRADR